MRFLRRLSLVQSVTPGRLSAETAEIISLRVNLLALGVIRVCE